MLIRQMTALAALFFLGAVAASPGAEPGWKTLSGHVPRELAQLQAKGRLPATNQLHLAIGLPLRDSAGLDLFLADVYDPASPNFRKFLTPAEFTARFGPAESDYAAVKEFARTNGLTITGTPDSRLLLDVSGPAAAVERAFHITLRTYRHPIEARDFFAPDTEPAVAAGLPVADISGLTDYYRPHSNSHLVTSPARAGAVAKSGSAPDGFSYFGNDFPNAYVPGTTLTGAGQMVGLLQFDGFYSNDIAAYAAAAGGGRTNIVIQTVLLDGFSGTPGAGNDEVSLDIEMAMSMAPGLSKIIVFEAPNSTAYFNDLLNAMASTNTYPLLNNLSCSWGGGGPKFSSETIFKKMAAQGQSFFNASGDSDAFTGSVPFPSESTNITQVGGTSLSMNGAGVSYASETAWNRNNNTGSSGGISTTYGLPYWQQGISMAASHGSTTKRNIPDVALTAEYCYVMLGNGSSGSYGGTSCAAPLWAGYLALVNQQAAAAGQNPVGFINPAVYAIGKSSSYTSCFNDITTGNNYSSSSPTNFPAVAGYDLCTGWGTPNGTNLINAILWPPPAFTSQPAGKNVTNGANVILSATTTSTTPVTYSWLFNGTNLPAGGNVSGITTNTLSITAATTNNSGNYQLVASNLTGSVISGVAVLNVGFVPTVSVSPTSLTLLAGSNAVFTATPGGSSPFGYQWKKNGTNFAGTGISGTNTSMLTLAVVTTNSTANYTVVVTNLFGTVTSGGAALTVVLPPGITSSLTNRTLQCGSNISYAITASGTAPLAIQWSLDGSAISGATNSTLTLTNIHLPNHAIAVVVTNLYGLLTSNATLTVQDTLAPVITLNGASRMTNELGSAFTDPGATATDLCAGSVAVTTSGSVNIAVVGTNTLAYLASDGNGNSATNTRTVVIRDTTPPAISWSFTNLTFAANSNCVAAMPDVTGTNYILATDLSGALTITQSPTNNFNLPLGTNTVVITVADASGNKSNSTNFIAVLDQTAPQILTQPQNQTNTIGGSATFSIAASACTPLGFQWYFNNNILPAQTNSSLALSNLNLAAAGNYYVAVIAAGGSSTSAVAALTVDLIPTSVALASSENPSGFKDALNFTASVTPTNATGTVQFFTNGAVFDLEALVAGTAVSTHLAALPRGANLVTAVYSGDANDLPSTNSFGQIVTNHPPMVAPAFYSLVAGLSLNILVSDLSTNWSDADADTLSLVGINPSTNGVVVTNGGNFLFYSNPQSVDDQFNCIISDGFGGTSFQAVFITIVPQTNSTPAIAAVTSAPAAGLTLKLEGGYGSTYVLESTTDFLSGVWIPVATNTLDITGIWQFTDSGVASIPSRFYRLKLVQ